MGTQDIKTALMHEGVNLVAVCDLYKGRIDKTKSDFGSTLFTTDNYKDILRRKDIDVVIIGTPDHWHKQISIDALNAGKNVYCEKPMVHSVNEGHQLINAWKKSGKIFMVGSQGLSSLGNEKAKELLASGAIGEINYAEGFWARHSPTGAWQYAIPKDASEKTVNWKQYISNTTQRPFDALRFFRWRNYLDYGTGMSGDLFVHLFSSLHFITGSKGPDKISALGGLRYWKDGREVPDVLLGTFNYPDATEHPGFNLSLRCNFVDGTSGTTYLRIVGSKGSMDVKWEEVVLRTNKISTDDPFELAKIKEQGVQISQRKKILPPNEIVFKAEDGYKGAHYDHHGNLIKAIRNNGSVVEDPIFGFRAAAPALLCNDSYFNNKFMHWDPVNMKKI
jgi:predicted dehydrogenase